MMNMATWQEDKRVQINTIIRYNLTRRLAGGKHEDERFIDVYNKDKGYTQWVCKLHSDGKLHGSLRAFGNFCQNMKDKARLQEKASSDWPQQGIHTLWS